MARSNGKGLAGWMAAIGVMVGGAVLATEAQALTVSEAVAGSLDGSSPTRIQYVTLSDSLDLVGRGEYAAANGGELAYANHDQANNVVNLQMAITTETGPGGPAGSQSGQAFGWFEIDNDDVAAHGVRFDLLGSGLSGHASASGPGDAGAGIRFYIDQYVWIGAQTGFQKLGTIYSQSAFASEDGTEYSALTGGISGALVTASLDANARYRFYIGMEGYASASESVPEPTSLALAGAGAVAAARSARGRRRSPAASRS